jgi:metallopeptidase YgjP-like protein
VTLFDLYEQDPVVEAGPYDEQCQPAPDSWGLSCEELEARAARNRAEAAAADATDVADADGRPEVEVRVSARRKKTSEAKWVAGRIVVTLPTHLRGKDRDQTINWLVDRLMAKQKQRRAVGDGELMARAVMLCERYRMEVRPTSVRWVTNQSARWGSCSVHSGEIRLSHRLRTVPTWVLDAVIVHELAHLRHPDHSPAFHAYAGRFPRHKEAGIFLAGYSLGLGGSNP